MLPQMLHFEWPNEYNMPYDLATCFNNHANKMNMLHRVAWLLQHVASCCNRE